MHNKKNRAAALVFASLAFLTLSACGGGGGNEGATTPPVGTGSPAPTASPAPSPAPSPSVSPAPSPASTPAPTPTMPAGLATDPDFQKALTLWRNDDLAKHPKGSCAGCHGADFFDLARIGSTSEDLARRAKIDGASQEEADALVAAIQKMRTAYKMPVTNARAFRPFQPGGDVLLPALADAPHIKAVKRDIAFGKQLESLLPTLYGARIDSLEKAKKARDELLDLAKGTNAAGANTAKLNLRSLPTGVTYPLWSADLHHGAAEGTLNDWVADIAHDPKPEFKAQWTALQDAYLKEPSTENFWKMYAAAAEMTRVPLLGACTMGGINPALSCGAVDNFNRDKFLSALMGQHMLRQQLAGVNDFLNGPLPFQYLDADPRFAYLLSRKAPELLPAHMWEIGDQGRTMLDDSSRTGSFRDNLLKLGYPKFVQDSIDPQRTENQEQHALRLAWFWIGFSFDPSFARIHGSNATKVGEYMVATLIEERMFIHNALAANMRLIAKGFLPEANVAFKTRPNRIEQARFNFLMHYSYFVGYGRTVLNWNESTKNGITFTQSLKDEQAALWNRMVANGFRMSMYLQMEALDQEPLKSDTEQKSFLKAQLEDSLNTNGSTRRGTLYAIHAHFAAYQPQHDAADDALMAALAAKAGATLPTY